ncbi:MAG: glycerol kinase [Candidatus Abyssobacteria bacterium SURF_5]|uniref:Glycerol kinase n=1 Tax=Abyssobacteria bacterium (strain SURF_5) TaxID=2093360 RepID=A0A3A4NBI5_ABYX5|nr:MAG: glycerol kinase [Candidatus Abyssubacteria bacterium SURF_5]
MSKSVLSIDAGTTSVRSMVVGDDGRVLSVCANQFKRSFPAAGYVEQDPEEMWLVAEKTIHQALERVGIRVGDLSAIGITGQRSTTIVWERATGRPLSPAVSWQDQRGAARAVELQDLGFITAASVTPAAKMEQILRAIPDGFERMRRNELAWGNVDSFLAWRLSGGAVHITDLTNAVATGYYDYMEKWEWQSDLLKIQGLDIKFFPRIVDSAGQLGFTSRRAFGAEVMIGAIIGDQQSAAYAQGCLSKGDGKITFGTSATCDVNTGEELKMASGSYPLVLWRRGEHRPYCVEGMVITAGAVFSWLTQLGLLENPAQASAVAASVADSNGVFFLPSLQGLGTPHIVPERRGTFGGLYLGATAAHLVRAAIEGVSFRVKEMVERIYLDAGLPKPSSLRVDGGAAANDFLMQQHADVFGLPVERIQPLEATAYGAALLAGESCGLWEPWSTSTLRTTDRIFEPRWNASQREERFQQWKRSCRL